MHSPGVGPRRLLMALTGVLLLSLALPACSPAPVPSTSRCTTNALVLSCPYSSQYVMAGIVPREVHWQVPRGTPPPDGWPAVIMFQGTGALAELTWVANPLEPFGAYEQTQTVQRLLDSGYVVITPETHLAGLTFWDTNNLLVDYLSSNDHLLMLELFVRIGAGSFGPVDEDNLFATGISSGGYMTSRMGVTYPERFRALAVASGSYATCGGPLCTIGPIPADHPPTLFLHGALDPVVPLWTMDLYRDALSARGVQTRRVVDPLALHRWIAPAPAEVLAWFNGHRT